jgi:REP element-mobilizing transposase RayT
MPYVLTGGNMRDALVEIYLHCIWGTWDRMPLIQANNQQEIHSSIIDQCEKFNCSVIALGGMPDHIHLLVRFPATITVANFIKGVKGSTSHLVTHQVNSQEFFNGKVHTPHSLRKRSPE